MGLIVFEITVQALLSVPMVSDSFAASCSHCSPGKIRGLEL